MVEHLHKLPEKGEKEIMFDLFVYGTLKRGGCNHNFLGKRTLKPKLEEAEFLRHEILKDHSIYLARGFNFHNKMPALIYFFCIHYIYLINLTSYNCYCQKT